MLSYNVPQFDCVNMNSDEHVLCLKEFTAMVKEIGVFMKFPMAFLKTFLTIRHTFKRKQYLDTEKAEFLNVVQDDQHIRFRDMHDPFVVHIAYNDFQM